MNRNTQARYIRNDSDNGTKKKKKKMAKITLDVEVIAEAWPEAALIPHLPRKKKKKANKQLLELITKAIERY